MRIRIKQEEEEREKKRKKGKKGKRKEGGEKRRKQRKERGKEERMKGRGPSLVVQWLRLHHPTQGVKAQSCWGTKILHTTQCV